MVGQATQALKMKQEYLGMVLPITITSIWWWSCLIRGVDASPQINLLNKGCSQYNATNLPDFYTNLNATFSDLKTQLNKNSTHFATAQQARGSDPVYAMVQCRNYLSAADCAACFAAAVSQIRNCSAANGARVIYDGCFLRYESAGFFDQTTLPGNVGLCSNKTASQATAFSAAAGKLLVDLQLATPKINGFFAATKNEVVTSGSGNETVYGVAQCAETISKTGCQDCLNVAYANLQSCLPDTDGRAVDAGCFLRYSSTSFFPDNQTTNIASFLKTGGNSRKKAIIIGVVVGGVGLLILIVGVLLYFKLSRKPEAARRGDILGATELQGPMNYKYKDLKSATKNFSEENKLGEGGFGDVYKGTLNNGKIVAVKKLAILQSDRAKANFVNEVKLISNVHHRNLIRLLGCCSKGPELLLIYEYMANNSLDRFIFGPKRGSLNWKQLNDIILGTARGLAYLHEEFHVCIIHRDIKTSNILLDDSFQPKIADFGLARLLPDDQTHLSTRFAGTLGYTAPEYAIHGQLSEKVDTYSYGVVVLEIISGQKSSEIKSDAMGEFLLEKAWKLYENGKHVELVDPNLDPNEYKPEDVKKIIEIALMCTQPSAAQRPTMSEVIVLLKSTSSVENRALTRPVFVDSDKRVKGDTSTSTASSTSNATVSVSQVSGR
ncbi:PREDICTED: cysteine-rich receptor-like protein kinase 2 [Prunus mume]|uniref:Cysteine-rich receptor-like protein kinase 2 n=1 Tax=Prunus mume TaxID=102107 RepID=A0ABM0NPH4_PRUMU|nr:PREDICTED: cysteine-rich receptor-like protein kinase 2 [Prunus mume]